MDRLQRKEQRGQNNGARDLLWLLVLVVVSIVASAGLLRVLATMVANGVGGLI